MSIQNKKLYFVIVLFLLTLVPFSTTSIPEWKIQVVDENLNPVPNLEVRQTWSNGGGGEYIETQRSDDLGVVVFPPRTQFLPIILRVPLRALAELNKIVMPHGAETSPYAYIWSPFARYERWLHYKKDEPLKTRLIVENPTKRD